MKEILIGIYNRFYNASGITTLTWETIGISVAVVVLAFLIEGIATGWKNSSLKRIINQSKSVQTDMIFWLLHTFQVFNAITFILCLGIAFYVVEAILHLDQLRILNQITHPIFQFALIFVLSDLKNYGRHRFYHWAKPLWEIHATHHSANEMSILTKYRDHFYEIAVARIIDTLFLILISAPIEMYILVSLAKELQGLLIHSNWQSSWGWLGKYLLVSPMMHQIHHSKEERHFGKNFGTCLVIWDRIFGSYYEPEKVKAYGIPNNPYNQKGFIWDVFTSIKKACLTIVR